MQIAIVQSDIIWGDPAANRTHLSSLIETGPRADLYVLPEMFSTGFNGVCEPEPSVTLDWMRQSARRYGCAFAGSIAISLAPDNPLDPSAASAVPHCVNRFCFVSPEGEFFYDKRHLFSFAGEQNRFVAGFDRLVFEWRGVRFLPMVCYDLRFPVWSRNRGDYDVMICVASWPVQRRYAWDTLLKARAIENQAYMVAVNRTGSDPGNLYDGGSVILNPMGYDLARCADGREDLVTAETDIESLREFRRNFPALNDADSFEIEY